MGCSKDLLSLVEKVFVFPISLLFGIPWVQQGMKHNFPIGRVTAGQADWCWAWVGVGQAEQQQIQSPSTLTQASTACSQQGPHINGGTLLSQTTLWEGRGCQQEASAKCEVCWSCNNDNYHDMFLLPLTTAGSGSCNIPSASLPEHKLGREAWTEMNDPGATGSCQVAHREHLLTRGMSAERKLLPHAGACGCSWPPLSLDVKQNFNFTGLWSWDQPGWTSHQMGRRGKSVTSTSTAARGQKISLLLQCMWHSSDLQWLPWRLGPVTESHRKELAKDPHSLAFRQALHRTVILSASSLLWGWFMLPFVITWQYFYFQSQATRKYISKWTQW